jgi:U3 small nucleolar RNA-associated protein 13
MTDLHRRRNSLTLEYLIFHSFVDNIPPRLYSITYYFCTMGEEREDDEVMSEDEEQEIAPTNDDDEADASASAPRAVSSSASAAAVTLSKSWSVKTAHGPLFTGGKVTHSAVHNCLLTPVFGDVCLTDCASSVRLGTVRGGESTVPTVNDNFDDDDDDGMLDADAITAYALAPNETTLLTCSHNTMMRQYAIVRVAPSATATETSSAAAVVQPRRQQQLQQLLHVQLQKTWGKSGHTLPVTDIQFHCSSVFAATGSVDGSVRVWDVRGGFVTHVYRPLVGSGSSTSGGSGTLSVTGMQWFPDVQRLMLAIARDNGSIAIHNLRDDQGGGADAVAIVLNDHVSAVTCMAWDVSRNVFVTTGRDAVINVWRVSETNTLSSRKKKSAKTGPTYTRLHTLPIYEQVEGMVLLQTTTTDNNSLLIATAGTKGQIRLWKMTKATNDDSSYQLKLISEQADDFGEARGGYLNLQRYSSNGDNSEQLIVADAEHNITFVTVTAADNKDAVSLTTDRTIVGHNDEILDLKVIPNSDPSCRKIVVATNSAQVRIFDLETFSCDVLDRHTATVLCVDVSPCGRYIATCGKDKQMRVWQTTTASNKCVAVAVGHTEAVGSTALSRKVGRYDVGGKAARNGGGAFCVTVSMDRTLKRWNLPGAADLDEAATAGAEINLKTFASTRAHEKDINIVSIAPNDSLIATGSQDKSVKLWKSTDLKQVATLKGHRRGVWDICFSPFDRIVATCSGDKTIKLWSLSDFSCVRTFQGHVASVLRVRFLSGGLQLISSGADGLVKLWTVRTNEAEATMDSHNNKVWALDLAPNGKELVSGGADSRIVVWEDTTKEVEDAKKAKEEEAILVDQKLANHLRRKEYAEALEISLERDKPHQTLKVLNAIIESDLQKGLSGLATLKTYAKGWDTDRLVRVLRYCREWNTRARNSHVALLTIKAVVSTVPVHKLAATAGVPEILAGIIPYGERHFERLDRLHSSSYLLDFALSSMGVIDASGDDSEFATWESSARLVLPPKQVDGRVDVGGNVVVGAVRNFTREEFRSDDEVVTIGDSDDSDEG